MMKKSWLFMYFAFLCSSYVQAGGLPVPLQFQEQTNWCWAGTSQGILEYFGNNETQCDIANFALTRTDCCVTPANCNVPLAMFGANPNSMEAILDNFAFINSNGQNGVLTPANAVIEMNAGRPFVIRWLWLPNVTGAAHFLTVKGFIGNNNNALMYINDPWDGERITDYNNAVNDIIANETPNHDWTHTLSITGETMPSSNISVNGSEGPTFTANTSANLNVNINLIPNGSSANSDWWVGYEQNGIMNYLTSTGTVTTVPTPWRQGNLAALNQSIFNGTLGVGTYTMYFAVDLTRNGVLDGDIYWDMITIQVN